MALKLDLKKFKKVSADDTHTTLEHKDGHQIKVAHKPLSKENIQELNALPMMDKKMARGGSVDPTIGHMPNDKRGNAIERSVVSETRHKMADGGEAEPTPQPTEDMPDLTANSTPAPQPGDFSQPTPQPTDNQDATPPPVQSATEPAVPPVDAKKDEAKALDSKPQDKPNGMSGSGMPSFDEKAFQSAPGYAESAKGINLAVGANQAKADQEQKALVDQSKQLETLNNGYKNTFEGVNQEIMSTIDDMQKHPINPNQYMDNLSTGHKIGNAIGLILGGMGSGILHQENPVLKFINNQIDRDIAGQQANLGRKESMVNAYYKQLGSLKDATEMTKGVMLAKTAADLQMAAAKAANPLAKASAMQALGSLKQQYMPLINGIAQRQMLNAFNQGGSNISPEAMAAWARSTGNKEVQQDVEARMVPGLKDPRTGQTAISPIPVPNEIKDKIVSQQSLISASNNLKNWIANHGSALDKMDPRTRAEGETLAAELQQLYRQGVGASTSKEEADTINKEIIPSNPSAFLASYTVSPKLKALSNSMTARLNTQKAMYKLPLDPVQEERPPAQYKVVNGVKYMRGPNGEAIKVQ